jgi:Sec-independent protein translocase protein TatA
MQSIPTLPELVLILIVVMIIFGAGRLSSAGDALGAMMRRLRSRK